MTDDAATPAKQPSAYRDRLAPSGQPEPPRPSVEKPPAEPEQPEPPRLSLKKQLDQELNDELDAALADFDFEFETFNRPVAERIKKRSRNIPAGLKLLKFREKEVVDPRDKGIEMYAVSHEYRYYGSGRIEGEVDALLKFRAKMGENDFVKVDEITIVY